MIRKFIADSAIPQLLSVNLEGEYENAIRYGQIRIGNSCVFLSSPLHIRYLFLSEIAWCYLRQEDSSASICCGRTTIPSYYLMIVTADQRCRKVAMDSPDMARAALTAIQGRDPSIKIGYTKDLANQFATR